MARPEKVGLLFEEIHLKKFFSHLRIDCVFDVGANAGQYANMLRERVGFKGPIISFEPIPEMTQLLKEQARKHPNWYIEALALSATAGEAVFNVMAGSQFSSLLQPQSHEYDDKYMEMNKVICQVPVKTSTLKVEYLKYKEKLGLRPFLKNGYSRERCGRR